MTVSTWSLTIGGFDLGGRVVLLGLLTGLTYYVSIYKPKGL